MAESRILSKGLLPVVGHLLGDGLGTAIPGQRSLDSFQKINVKKYKKYSCI
jgi:hypothetical protein